MMKHFLILAGLVLAGSAGAEEYEFDPQVPPVTSFLDTLTAYEPVAFAEHTVVLPKKELAALLKAKPGANVALPTLNLGLSKGEPLAFRRYNPYATQARIHVNSADGYSTLAPSQRVFMLGRSNTGSASLIFDPRSMIISGLVIDGGESYRASGHGQADGSAIIKLLNMREELANTPFQCGTNPSHNSKTIADEGAFPSLNAAEKGGPILFQTTIAVDTNTAFTGQARFAGNATNVRNYIEDMFAGMNAIYERDLQLHLNIGDVFVNLVSNPTDPYDSLSSFSSYWSANRGAIDRDFAMLLGGIGGGFSGVAFVNVYCNNFSGYSYNGIGGTFSTAAAAQFVGHEVGHNLGSSHTHCETLGPGGAFVDQCYTCEDNDGTNCFTSCYAGPTTMCQPGGTGTIMSYCHADAAGFDGAGPAMGTSESCTSTGMFHPLIVGKVSGLLASNNPACIDDFLPPGDFDLTLGDAQLEVCKPAQGATNVTVTANQGTGFVDPVTLSVSQLPSGATGSFVPNPATPGTTAVFTVGNTAAAADGSYNLSVTGTANNTQISKVLELILVSAAANGPTLVSPADAAMNLSTSTTLDWSPVSGAISYRIDIATDSGFANIVETATVTSTLYQPTMLAVQTTYYWRVVANPACGDAALSVTRSFATSLEFCATPNVVVVAQGNNTFSITPGLAANVLDMDVLVEIDTTFAEAFRVTLSNGGTSQRILEATAFNGCNTGSVQSLLARFDDEAGTTVLDACFADNLGAGLSVTPTEPLSPFDGSALATQWQLRLDNFSTSPGPSGTLVRWCLVPTPDTPVTNTLDVSVTGPGSVTSSPAGIDCPGTCSADYAGGMVNLTATPDGLATFQGWGGDCSGTGACSVDMSAMHTVSALFADPVVQYTLSVTVNGPGSVSSTPAGIDCPGTCAADFDEGTMVSLAQSPDGTAVFDGWSGACSGTGGCGVTMSANLAVGLMFTDDDLIHKSGFEDGEGPPVP